MRLDFSATNFKAKVTGWRLSVEKKANTLFPTVCDTARSIAGIIAATADLTQSEHLDPQILARANLPSEDEEDTAADSEHEKDNTQAINENHCDRFDEHHDDGGDNNGIVDGNDDGGDNNGVDDGNDGGVDDDHNNGGDDMDGHENEGGNRPGTGSEEDEDGDDQEDRPQAGEDSTLTDIDSNSEEAPASDTGVSKNVQVVLRAASGSRTGRKGVRRVKY